MKTSTLSLPLLVLVLSLVVPPIALANIVSFGAGIILVSTLGSSLSQQWVSPIDTIPVLTQVISHTKPPSEIHQLGKGYVIIKHVNGKLATRFVRQTPESIEV